MPSPRLSDRLRDQARQAPLISVGVLTADWMSLGPQLQSVQDAGVELLHFDVMDGCFCPMTTFGPPIIKGIKTSMLKDVHLMIDEPLSKVEAYVAAGADVVTVHAESGRHLHRVFQMLGQMTNANDPQRGIVRGIALNPGTPLDAIDPVIDDIEMVLLLAVNPGWGGQKFIASTSDRLAQVKKKFGDRVLVGVDGGVTRDNVATIAGYGADLIVTGSAVYDGKAPRDNAKFMLEAVKR